MRKEYEDMKKKIILFIALTVLVVAGMALLASYVFSGGKYDNISWEYRNDVLTIKGEGDMPDFYYECPLDKYAEKAKELVIEEGITSVTGDTFYGFNKLEKITLPDSVNKIGDSAFDCCISLKEVDFGEGVVSIGRNAFEFCIELESVKLPESLESLGCVSFSCCEKLKTVHMGSKLKEIGWSAFDDCHEDIRFFLNEENPFLVCEDGVFFSEDKKTLLYYCNVKKNETYTIPEGIVKIAPYAFLNSENLKKVDFPQSIQIIDEMAFCNNSNLHIVTIPDSVTEIGKGAFGGCINLERVYIGKGVSSELESVFVLSACISEISVSEENMHFSSVDGVLFNKDKTKLIMYPAAKGGVVYEVPSTVNEIGRGAFSNSNFLGVILPDNLVSVGESAFSNSTIEEINIPASVTSLGENAFRDCESLKKIIYEGTMSEWKKNFSDSYYDSRTANHTVICSDGEINVETDDE
ncbi:MAG: leucine-rich repeat domain-containing protein [Ruminococcaceae bacterium]|nr:leucine-rich repeat domain-containing protein [Oscillospiraceae bacterium]